MAQHSIKQLETIRLIPGLVLGQDLKSPHGAILLPSNTVLTDYIISKIKAWCFNHVNIMTLDCPSEVKVENIEEETAEDVSFLEMYTQTVENIGIIFEKMQVGKKIPLRECSQIVEKILEQTADIRGVVTRLRNVKSGNKYTYNHSLNVGIYAVLLGIWLKYDESVLRQLAMAGLLHDIGKARISAKIIDKPGALTVDEFSRVKRHAAFGYKMIENTIGPSRQVRIAVAQHHEREDGSGYPLGLGIPNIHPYAKIISIADVYDSVTSDRAYRLGSSPYKAADLILDEAFSRLDPAVASIFVHHMTTLFFYDKVRLNTGMIGTIVHMDPITPTRPLLQTERGYIDLRKKPALQIVEIL